MIFICSLIFLFLIKIRLPKGVSISESFSLTSIEFAVGLLVVDDTEGVGDVGLHVGHLKVEPLVVVAGGHVRVQHKIVLLLSHLRTNISGMISRFKLYNFLHTHVLKRQKTVLK